MGRVNFALRIVLACGLGVRVYGNADVRFHIGDGRVGQEMFFSGHGRRRGIGAEVSFKGVRAPPCFTVGVLGGRRGTSHGVFQGVREAAFEPRIEVGRACQTGNGKMSNGYGAATLGVLGPGEVPNGVLGIILDRKRASRFEAAKVAVAVVFVSTTAAAPVGMGDVGKTGAVQGGVKGVVDDVGQGPSQRVAGQRAFHGASVTEDQDIIGLKNDKVHNGFACRRLVLSGCGHGLILGNAVGKSNGLTEADEGGDFELGELLRVILLGLQAA